MTAKASGKYVFGRATETPIERTSFGLSVPEQLEWRHWQPGGEYSKTLVMKNVSTKPIKVSHKLNQTKVFSMEFPEVVRLSAGMSHSLKVVFRPVRHQVYEDRVELVCDGGTIAVPIRASLPVSQLQIPVSLDFGFVPVQEVARTPFAVRNTGDVELSFAWALQAPFAIEPARALLPPGQSARFEAVFKPQDASAFTASAACKLDNGQELIMQITGNGKFPYLSIETPSVDFGAMTVGTSRERMVRFGNHSAVAANFTVTHSTGAQDGVFHITPTQGTLGPNEFSTLRILYTPASTGTFSSETFSLATAGGNKVALAVAGEAVGPVVAFSTRVLNFGNVRTEQHVPKVLYIENRSEVPVAYSFRLECGDVFGLQKPSGTIQPYSTAHVVIVFKCNRPANYWRRAVCVIQDADPVAVDLLATCFDEKMRPPPLATRHIADYFERLSSGQGGIATARQQRTGPSSMRVDDATKGNAAALPASCSPGMAPASLRRLSSPGVVRLDTASPGGEAAATASLPGGPDAWPLLFEGPDPAASVTVDTELLDYGTCSRLSSGEHKVVTMTNNTDAKLLAFVSVPGWRDAAAGQGGASNGSQCVFQVFPETAEVGPRGQASFRVAFRPPKDGQYYSQTLHVCAFVKAMRNFRLVNDDQVVPPWSVPVTACGNTFARVNPEPSPNVSLSTTAVIFPPCHVGAAVHQTLTLSNNGDTPVQYNITLPREQQALLAMRPTQGVLPPRSHTLVALRFRPTGTRPWATTLPVAFNNSPGDSLQLLLRGCGYEPRLAVEPDSKLVFRPTCIGATSQAAMTVHNPSRVPVAFLWRLAQKLRDVITVVPQLGILRGNESCEVSWTFSPLDSQTYNNRAACLLLPVDAATDFIQQQLEAPESSPMEASLDGLQGTEQAIISLLGEGTQAAMSIEPQNLDFGSVKVGYPVTRTLHLTNQSDGVLRYTLELLEEGADSPGATPSLEDPPIDFGKGRAAPSHPRGAGQELWVDEPAGSIPARSSRPVVVTLYPLHSRAYRIKIACRTATAPALAAAAAAATAASPALSLSRPLSGSGSLLGAAATLRAWTPSHARAEDAAAAGAAVTAAATIAAVADFPRLVATDVACEGVPKPVAWEQMSLTDINRELQSGLTRMELTVGQMERAGTLTTDAALRMLRPFHMDFGTRAVGSDPITFHVQFTNPSPVPVSWELVSYDDPNIEMENWVEPAQPHNATDKARAFVVANRLFQLSPRAGVLQQGQVAQVALTYNPSCEGSHSLPMFLRLQDSKRLLLQLEGRAAEWPAQHLLLLPSSRTFQFQPVPIGETDPPLQQYALRNGGNDPLGYSLDVSSLQRLAEDNYGFEIMKLASTAAATGEIEPHGTAILNWLFTPLEDKQYEAQVLVHLSSGDTQFITLRGNGYHPKQRRQQPSQERAVHAATGEGFPSWLGWPCFNAGPALGLTERLLTVSSEALSLSTMLVGGLVRALLVLQNDSCWPLAFAWDLGCFLSVEQQRTIGGMLELLPASGTLAPGERLVCRVCFQAGLQPQLFEAEVNCCVKVDTDAVTYSTDGTMGRHSPGVDGPVEWHTSCDDNDDAASHITEEIIAQHPERPCYSPGTRLHQRLPVHLGMTEATILKSQHLGDMYTQTLQETQRQRELQQRRRVESMPAPQLATVTIAGRILTRDQVRMGSYIPLQEMQAAWQLLSGGACGLPAVAAAARLPGLVCMSPLQLLALEAHATRSAALERQQQRDEQFTAGVRQAAAEGLTADAPPSTTPARTTESPWPVLHSARREDSTGAGSSSAVGASAPSSRRPTGEYPTPEAAGCDTPLPDDELLLGPTAASSSSTPATPSPPEPSAVGLERFNAQAEGTRPADQQPRSSQDATVDPGRRGGSSGTDGIAAAADVLQQMLTDIMGDEDVKQALAAAELQPIPDLHELRERLAADGAAYVQQYPSSRRGIGEQRPSGVLGCGNDQELADLAAAACLQQPELRAYAEEMVAHVVADAIQESLTGVAA